MKWALYYIVYGLGLLLIYIKVNYFYLKLFLNKFLQGIYDSMKERIIGKGSSVAGTKNMTADRTERSCYWINHANRQSCFSPINWNLLMAYSENWYSSEPLSFLAFLLGKYLIKSNPYLYCPRFNLYRCWDYEEHVMHFQKALL